MNRIDRGSLDFESLSSADAYAQQPETNTKGTSRMTPPNTG